ncbi:hypothetical protein JY97_13435 [Alkalispirochaeta odontotermitis]|nr:hypothetical protein JY97_13435 [Alkalispirochaeta odontotermitis]CAB1077074.1 hypothetical protein D1AOALGA4SA_4870 [Olavius algarvensis Delta 1 endosymbiont]
MFEILNLDYWDLFEIWFLEFGVWSLVFYLFSVGFLIYISYVACSNDGVLCRRHYFLTHQKLFFIVAYLNEIATTIKYGLNS